MHNLSMIQYVSYKLHTIVRRYHTDSGKLETYCGSPGFTDRFSFSDRLLKEQKLPDPSDPEYPVLAVLNDSILYSIFRIPDIAAVLYLNPDYLSQVLKKHEGITIHEFVIREKIQLVKNMLIYSQYTYSEIAARCKAP